MVNYNRQPFTTEMFINYNQPTFTTEMFINYNRRVFTTTEMFINYNRPMLTMTSSCRLYQYCNRSDATTIMMGGAYNYKVNSRRSIVNRAGKLRMTYGCAADVTVRVTRSVSTWR